MNPFQQNIKKRKVPITAKHIFRALIVSKFSLFFILVMFVIPLSAFEAHVVNVTATIERRINSCPANEFTYTSQANPEVWATQIYTANPDSTITIRTTFSKAFVDNTYGVNSIGWKPNRPHRFNDLKNSDHVQIALLDNANVKKMEFKIDYISQSSNASSGYKTLCTSGGDGAMLTGNQSDIVGCKSSIGENLNTFGYVLLTDSPATDASYTPNPSYPNWIFDVLYEVTVRASAFGA